MRNNAQCYNNGDLYTDFINLKRDLIYFTLFKTLRFNLDFFVKEGIIPLSLGRLGLFYFKARRKALKLLTMCSRPPNEVDVQLKLLRKILWGHVFSYK